MKAVKIGFLGYGTKALDCLMEHEAFEVLYFFAPKARLCEDVYLAKEKYKGQLKLEIVENNQDLAKRFSEIEDVDCFLMNACPIILNKDVLSKMRVFNIHPGDLHSNRGHQPHCWTVRLGETSTKIVLHTVSEGIDVGKIIKSVEVPVSKEDGAKEVLDYTEAKIPILLDGLYQYLQDESLYESIVEDGTYRQIMKPEDYRLDFSTDSKYEIQRKILSRNLNHGAFFLEEEKGQKVYVDRLLTYDGKEELEEKVDYWVEILAGRQELVFVFSDYREMVFHLNKVEAVDKEK